MGRWNALVTDLQGCFTTHGMSDKILRPVIRTTCPAPEPNKRAEVSRTPRQYALVKAIPKYVANFGVETLIFLGEIPNMPGYCVIYDIVRSQIVWGYHTEYFVELTPKKA